MKLSENPEYYKCNKKYGNEGDFEEAKKIKKAFDRQVDEWTKSNNELVDDVISRAAWRKEFYETNEVEPFSMGSFF